MCNFSPTCSQFYRQSIHKYGIIAGSLIGADRLQRCNPWSWSYLDKYYYGVDNDRIIDPPEEHHKDISNTKYKLLSYEKQQNQNVIEIKTPKTNLDFADYLFSNKDYQRAIGEYKRIFYSTTDTIEREYSRFLLGEIYLQTNDYGQALQYFTNDKSMLCKYNQARVYLAQAQFDKVRQVLNGFNDDSYRAHKVILIGVSYLEQGDYTNGSQYLKTHADFNNKFINDLSKFDGTGIKHRNRLLATVLSTIIPGAGQIYSNRLGDGIYSLLTVTTCALITSYYWRNDNSKIKFSIFALLTTFFYAGNIYGANIAARDFNDYETKKYQNRIFNLLQEVKLVPDYKKLFYK